VRIYVAGTFGDRSKLKKIVKRIRATGHEVSSSWMYEGKRPEGQTHEHWFQQLALKDLAEVRKANLLILDTRTRSPRGGKNVEFGAALVEYKFVWVVGPVRNVFETLADEHFPTWAAAIARLKEAV